MAASHEIAQLKAKLTLYEEHHRICNVICQASRNSIDETLVAINAEPQHIQIMSPSPSVHHGGYPPVSPGLRIIRFSRDDLEKSSRKRKNCTDKTPRQPRQRWLDARTAVIKDINNKQLQVRTIQHPDTSLLGTENSAFGRGRLLAKSVASLLVQAQLVDSQARVWLFSFLSSIVALVKLAILSDTEVDDLMRILDVDGERTYYYRRQILAGAAWMNDEVLLGLCEKGWELNHATAAVALHAPSRPFEYAQIKHKSNKDPIVEAFHTKKGLPHFVNIPRWSIPDQVLTWELGLSKQHIIEALYPPRPSRDKPVLNLQQIAPSTVAVTNEQLRFVSRQPIPNSTDVLETYDWRTDDAVTVINPTKSTETAKNTRPAYSDQTYDYYYVALEHATTSRLSNPSLVEAIQQSKQWQEEQIQWSEEPADDFRKTKCLTFGLVKDLTERCIVMAVVGGPPA
ncbi:uncharacterized protein EKO05_0008724 [Ascochyta rabiei]|uniref:uncharacterized protein n=1 Tax=Didymella rabiei TaxID=5454 RepID=UPI0018FF858B|nr:uncharacterized protein EKO05_0008724 [Ascochyta rabiei]UPX18424.1 hypothetical protein EKO05_0008724 [Ascochyta rabiei]